jgi:hypothetical protein
VKKALAALAGLVGIAWLKRRKHEEGDPADDLRAKLAETRETAAAQVEDQAAEIPVDEVPDVEDRRREVHERARQRIDELSGD